MKQHKKHEILNKFVHNKGALIGIVVLIIEILVVVLLPAIMKLDPLATNASAINLKPTGEYLLGTDDIGRDMFARLLYGTRISLLVGAMAAILSAVIGVPLGLLAGYYEGVLGIVIMRLADIFMSFPAMVFTLVTVAVFGTSTYMVAGVIGFLGWPEFARIIYSKAISIKHEEYVEAAQAIGAKSGSVIMKYIFPNAISPIWVTLTFKIASAILIESSLSFLGVGIQPPAATLGNILYAAQNLTVITLRPWRWIPAGVVLMLTIICINLVGDGIRDALDPKQQ